MKGSCIQQLEFKRKTLYYNKLNTKYWVSFEINILILSKLHCDSSQLTTFDIRGFQDKIVNYLSFLSLNSKGDLDTKKKQQI